ncbi:uncharacterized protein LOC126911310 [Spodoptera frugiperda]|uniref:Uncharacterized protein LOC126911310 n=1 Tax=Spodoptera frugiperda TaxID=7108 RepID=A0A9R0EWP2_SPOFR|nr:uncharacterized protein LOC126911310 [Spodoptera frugiperda]
MHIIQANLHRSKLATIELIQAAARKGISLALVQEPYVGNTGEMKQYPGARIIQCTINRQKPVKAAVIVFSDRLRVIHDPQLVTETEAAVLVTSGSLQLGVISVYLEGDQDINHNLVRLKESIPKLRTKNLIVAGDVNAWSPWWGSSYENQRGADYNSFLNEMDLHILNTGDTPTFEALRRDRFYTSIVDVTACSTSLLARVENWTVDRGLTTSDHNAITFDLQLQKELEIIKPVTTRIYYTKKANWNQFKSQLRTSLSEKKITPQKIMSVQSSGELETMVTAYINAITEACEKAIPKIRAKKGKCKPPWWTDSLEDLKTDVLRKKRRIRNAAPSRKQFVIDEYIQAKEAYTSKADEEQTRSWKEFCTTQKMESMWDGVYRIIRKTTKHQEDALLRNAEGATLSPAKSAELLAKTFYPDDSENTDDSHHAALRKLADGRNLDEITELSENDPLFSQAEVDLVLNALNCKKAPGADGLTADICTAAIQCERELFLAIANTCLERAHFPTQWKSAHVIILRKPGKEDYTHPKSYRPIGLLSVFGKIVEKLMIGRIQWHIFPTLHKNQYGFLPQRGTEDALYDLVERVKTEFDSKNIVILVSLDIEGAFDNAWWPSLKQQLIARKCPRNLYALVDSYLSERKIKVNYAGASSEKGTNKGCVQGSVGGPTFWNLILDSLLHRLSSEGVYCQAFADDVVLLFSSHKVSVLEQSVNSTLEIVTAWGASNKLKFGASKTNAMLLTRKLAFSPPDLYMSGTRLNLVDQIKLLGLTIDRKLTFKPHISETCKKAADIYKQLARAAKVTWGLNGEITRTIYVAVIEPIVLYAANVWAPVTELELIKKQLNALQRGFAQKICRAYRTVSLTSATVLSGTIPLDLRVQESASLYRTKRGFSHDYLPPGKELERDVPYLDQPHPSKLISINYELLENDDSGSSLIGEIAGPHIYTDGSKIDGGVGSALTWWEGGRESAFSKFSLDSSCTVFQSELYALNRATKMAEDNRESRVNIMSDSRSSLDVLKNPRVTHQLAKGIKQCIENIREQGREVRFYWLRAHVGTAGNERADELAKAAAKTKDNTTADYCKVPMSYVKKKIRDETIRKWQDRYTTSTTGQVTKSFLPNVNEAYRLVRSTKLTPAQVQALTGHGGIAEYLHRFKLKESAGCECDSTISESVWHIILDCPRFLAARTNLEHQIDANLDASKLSSILTDDTKRPHFLEYIDIIFRRAAERNSTLKNRNPATTNLDSQTSSTTAVSGISRATITDLPTIGERQILLHGEHGAKGIRIRGVALFMSTGSERLGIAFCNTAHQKWLTISPGLASLLNGSTFKTSMRRRVFEALPEIKLVGQSCRLLRTRNKTIAMFSGVDAMTCFEQACKVLSGIGKWGQVEGVQSRVISVDAAVVASEKGKIADLMGCVQASEYHEVIVYEARGEDLSFLRKPVQDPPSVGSLSGSERLQQRHLEQSALQQQQRNAERQHKERASRSNLWAITSAICTAAGIISSPFRRGASGSAHGGSHVAQAHSTQSRSPPTRAAMGHVCPPKLRHVATPRDHIINAFLEFVAVIEATKQVNQRTCKTILQAYLQGNELILNDRLEAAEAVIYDNSTSKVLRGASISRSMAAYNATAGFVSLDEKESDQRGVVKFRTPPEDSLVVVARCTRIMLDDGILKMAKSISESGPEGVLFGGWDTPTFHWTNGVPGCGKTTWIIDQFEAERDLIVTTTTEAANDLRDKLSCRIGGMVKSKVRTMASILVNGFKEQESCHRMMVDEALMNHFGAIVMAARITQAKEVLLIGDVNQLPFIDRDNLFPLIYTRPTHIVAISRELLCTHRNPMDVAYALGAVYCGIYSARSNVRSLDLKSFSGTQIPKSSPNTLYLVHTQAEKESLKNQGYGSGAGSRVLTVHEAQGLSCAAVVVVNTAQRKQRIHDSVPHAVVAISRHTDSCVYYTDVSDDAISKFIRRAAGESEQGILDYNLKMAIRNRDATVVGALLGGEGSL